MTTIELPPLPPITFLDDKGRRLADQWRYLDYAGAYARLAIEQDRARRGEPVAEVVKEDSEYGRVSIAYLLDDSLPHGTKLYTHPPIPVPECQYAKDVGMPEHRCAVRCQYDASPQPSVDPAPEGWKPVPMEATREMMQAAEDYYTETELRPKGQWWWNRLYQAYIAAAPLPPSIDPANRERAKVIAEAFEQESTLSWYHDLIEAAALLRKAYLP